MTDLVIRGGTVATDQDVFEADVAVTGEKVSAVARAFSISRALVIAIRKSAE